MHNAIFALAEEVILSRLVGGKAPATNKSKLGLGLMALSGFLILMTLTCLAYALFFWLEPEYGPLTASLLISVITAGLSILTAIIGYIILKRRKRRLAIQREEMQSNVADTVQQILHIVQDEAFDAVRNHPKMSVLMAALTGFVVSKTL